MNIHSPSQNVAAFPGFAIAITAAVVDGVAIGVAGYTRAMVTFHSNPSGVGTTSNCIVQESPDGSTAWANVPGAAFAQVATTGSDSIQVADINLELRLPFLRLVHTGAGASAAGVATGTILLFNARGFPVSQVEPVGFAV